MVVWKNRVFDYASGGKILISAAVFKDAYDIIREHAKKKSVVAYSDLMDKLKKRNHTKINRGTIGSIIGEISNQISLITKPSIYPSSIVVHKGSTNTGIGFWALKKGTMPPSKIPIKNRKMALSTYQRDVFQKPW